MSAPGCARIVPETAGLRGLGAVNTHLVAQVQRRHPVAQATLDVDASGNVLALTVEHASERTGIPEFSYEQVAA